LDRQGELHLTGRADSLVRSGGAFSSPERLRLFLEACPGVAAAEVWPVPDTLYGQRLMARLRPDGTSPLDQAAIRAAARAALGPAMTPRRIELRP
jgi:acyl-CoA synthetase (AMP-forming)/AMP-acid ligase II